MIRISTLPTLSPTAIKTLQYPSVNHTDAETNFKRLFGDYYVAGLRIGGMNATMVSAAVDQSSTTKDMAADLTFKILGFEKSKNLEDHEAAPAFRGALTLSGFDSLDICQDIKTSNDEAALGDLKPLANADGARGKTVEARSRERLKKLGIQDQSVVTSRDAGLMYGQGLVIEVLLLPFAGLRDFVQISRSRVAHLQYQIFAYLLACDPNKIRLVL